MNPPRWIPLFAVLILQAAAETGSLKPEEDTYVLAKPDNAPKPGFKCVTSKVLELKNANIKITVGNQTKEGTSESMTTETEAVEFIDADKIKRTLTTATRSQTVTLAGESRPQNSSSPLLNCPVIMTRNGPSWSAALEKGMPTPFQAHLLKELKAPVLSTKDVAAYGKDPHKVGDSWSISPNDFPFCAGESEAASVGNVKITFKGIEDYEGKKCARLDAVIEMTSKEKTKQDEPVMTLKGSATILRSLDDMIDLKRDFAGIMEAHGETSLNGDMIRHETIKIE